MADLFDRVRIPEALAPADVIREIGIRSHGRGVFIKDPTTGEQLGSKQVFTVIPDCLVANIVFAWEGAIARTTSEHLGLVASHRFPMWKPREGVACLDYFVHYFTSVDGIGIAANASPGGAGRNRTLNQTAFLATYLPVPPLPEQKKIAAILSAVDDAIRATQAVIDQTRRVKEGLLQELLTRGIGPDGKPHTRFKQTEIGEIPEGWEVRALDDLVLGNRPICYGILKPGSSVEGGVPVVKVKNIVNNEVSTGELLLTAPEIDAQYKRSKLKGGDVLLTIRGTTGRVAIVPPELEDANITQDTARLSIDERSANARFVFHVLQSRRLQQVIDLHTIGQAVKGINIAEVRKLPIPLPGREEQLRVVERIDAHDGALSAGLSALEVLTALKSGLLSDLLTGRVRVTR